MPEPPPWRLQAYTIPEGILADTAIPAAEAEGWAAAGELGAVNLEVRAASDGFLLGAALIRPDGELALIGMLPAPIRLIEGKPVP